MRLALLMLGIGVVVATALLIGNGVDLPASPSREAAEPEGPRPLPPPADLPTVIEEAPSPAVEKSTPAVDPAPESLLETARFGASHIVRFEAMEALGKRKGCARQYRTLLLELLGDPDQRLRDSAIHNLQPFVKTDKAVVMALVALVGDLNAEIRESVVSVLGGVSGFYPEARAVVLAGIEDENPEVRETAAYFLGNLGESGARMALEVMISGEWSPDTVDDLANIVVEYGLLPEALERKPSDEAIAAMLIHLCESIWDYPEHLKALRGRYAGLMNKFVPDHNYGWKEFFETAEDGGDGHLIRDTALASNNADAIRVGAVGATMRREDEGQEFYHLIDCLFAEHGTSAVLRMGLVEHLDTMRQSHSRQKKRVLKILREIARTDPSPEVREAAKANSKY